MNGISNDMQGGNDILEVVHVEYDLLSKLDNEDEDWNIQLQPPCFRRFEHMNTVLIGVRYTVPSRLEELEQLISVPCWPEFLY